MRRFPVLAVATAVLLLVFGGVAFADVEVTITDDGLDPESVSADVREDIVWTNATDAAVSLVGEDPTWESGPIEPGATFSIQITQEGTYTYGSEDGSLTGELVVGGGEQQGEDDPFDEPTEEAEAVEEDEGDDEPAPLPDTGVASAVPALLSLLLIGFGGGLLALTPRTSRRG